jgi:mRNA interferase RelE/StbE
MAYQVELRPAASKSLDKLPRGVHGRILAKAQSLANEPRPHGAIKLEAQTNLYRVRVGNYRIVYAIDDTRQVVTITIIADRKESYRGL